MQINQKVNVLVFGSGAREQAIAESIFKSPFLNKIFHAQAGYKKFGEEILFKDYEDLGKKCVDNQIDLAIIGPENPLCEGIVDILKKHGIFCIGVDKNWSQLESSKIYGKKFMGKYDINTAKYQVITKENLPDYEKLTYPIVIKADGLCKGKGVVIAKNQAFAQKTVDEFLNGKFGDSSKTILLEEYIEGEEVSIMALFDGENLLDLIPTRDFKKLNKSPSAPNTGGMGAYCPFRTTREQRKKLKEYKINLQNALKSEKADFCGFIYSGLIWARKGNNWDWHVLEYNVRLGDPETQAILTHLKTDFLSILIAATKKELKNIELEYKNGYSACLIVAAQGYPANPKIGDIITLNPPKGVKTYFAGIKENVNGQMVSCAGRVLSLCTTGDTPFAILKNIAKKITMKNKYYRKDIEID